MTQFTDPTDLVNRIYNGDADAEEELVLLYRDMLYGWLNGISGDFNREDIAQDILITIVTKAREGKFHNPKFLPKYMHSMMKNRINTILRRKYNKPHVSLDAVAQFTPNADDTWSELVENEQKQQLLRVISTLNDKEKLLLHERYVEGLPSKDIAERHGIKDVAVRKRLSRLIAKLKNMVESMG